MVHHWKVFCSILSSLALVGCGGEELNTVPISGTVKVQGKSLTESNALLRFENEKDAASATTITVNPDGTFAGEAVPGPSKVYLYGIPEDGGGPTGGHKESAAKTSEAEGGGGTPLDKEFQPENADVKGEGKYDFDFNPA